MEYFVWVLAWIHIVCSWLCSDLRLYDIDLHCMSRSYVQIWVFFTWIYIVFSSHEFFVSHMDLRWIGWQPCCDSFGTCTKYSAKRWSCLRSSDLWTFSSTLYLVLSKYIAYHFPLGIILWGASLLYWNLITLMLWHRYPLVYSNPSNFSLEKWRNKLTPCNFPSFELVTLFPRRK